MGLFKSRKKKPEDNRQEAVDRLKDYDPAIRPGGVFVVKLLMREQCEMPSAQRIQEVLSRHLGRIESFGDQNKGFRGYAALDYMARFSDREVPVQLCVLDCQPFDGGEIDEMQRSQMWDCQGERDRILSECKYAVLANDMLGGGLPTQVRANMLMDYVEALLELFPSCEAVLCHNSGKMIMADEIRNSEVEGLNRYIRFCVNVRLFNINGTGDHVIDTLGQLLLMI